jgi:hypothetical protein
MRVVLSKIVRQEMAENGQKFFLLSRYWGQLFTVLLPRNLSCTINKQCFTDFIHFLTEWLNQPYSNFAERTAKMAGLFDSGQYNCLFLRYDYFSIVRQNKITLSNDFTLYKLYIR